MLRYSRHAKRRMALYGISEADVTAVVKEGKREELGASGRVSFMLRLEGKSTYPIKVVGLEQGKDFLVITAYPLKRGRI
jgi:hypothetical protein